MDLSHKALTRRQMLRGLAVAGLAAGAVPLLGACGGDQTGQSQRFASAAPASGTPRRGGSLKVGLVGGGSSETIDAQVYYSRIDGTRLAQLYEPLMQLKPDATGYENVLAESVEPNATGDEWTIRVKDGIEFHNGKTLDAEDVRFTFGRIKASTAGGSQLFKTLIDDNSYQMLDKRTLRFRTRQPFFPVPDMLNDFTARVVPVGYDPLKPVGTGPFRFGSFTAGRESVFPRFDNYRIEGRPYVDEVRILSFPDSTALVNSMMSGQIDAIEAVSLSAVPQLSQNPEVLVLRGVNPDQWIPVFMRVDLEPFTDPRVREAMKLLVDRDQMVKQVFGGHGEIENDYQLVYPGLYGDPGIPQRSLDVDKAKSLLKAAGHEGFQVELVTAPFVAEAIGTAEVFAAQAKAAGVDVRVRQLDTGQFYSGDASNRNLSSDYWTRLSYYAQADTTLAPPPGVPFNETHFADKDWAQAWSVALSSPDEAKRRQAVHDCMRLEWERGGYINWGAQYVFDAVSTDLSGIGETAQSASLGMHNFRDTYFVA
ncbi:peptide ABC transporter substrate-binding protein [Gordonia sp. SID5947]|uniref:ABC transporter substrate-binding protein n=1 Tax=Gordonia sp. SID5947 TaxID=2690315 RepID=UPI00136C15A5|nr:ABC transporter substrate-binding protein [Gordonia sp. SID5947]MYR07994.1 peptide ABC transporter substrate-binding protein [Gordonia sp. SID5947]